MFCAFLRFFHLIFHEFTKKETVLVCTHSGSLSAQKGNLIFPVLPFHFRTANRIGKKNALSQMEALRRDNKRVFPTFRIHYAAKEIEGQSFNSFSISDGALRHFTDDSKKKRCYHFNMSARLNFVLGSSLPNPYSHYAPL